MKEFILYLWQLPQNILGVLLIFITRAKNLENNNCWYFVGFKYFSGVSLGKYIILPDYIRKCYIKEYVIKHEIGHCFQSLYFGWLYLLVIGIPSLFNNIVSRFNKKWSEQYYEKYPEKWDNKLGGNI